MYQKWVVRTNTQYWGVGDTEEIAKEKAIKAGAKKKDSFDCRMYTSELPFAPPSRPANENEADLYVDDMGGICSLRCNEHETKC